MMKPGTEDKGSEANFNNIDNMERAIMRYERTSLDSDRINEGGEEHKSTDDQTWNSKHVSSEKM